MMSITAPIWLAKKTRRIYSILSALQKGGNWDEGLVRRLTGGAAKSQEAISLTHESGSNPQP